MPTDLENKVNSIEAQLREQARVGVETLVNSLVSECRLTALEAPKAIVRALADPTYIDELRARPQMLPGGAPLDFGGQFVSSLAVLNEDVRNVFSGMQKHCVSGDRSLATATVRASAIGAIYRKERDRIIPVLNAAVNTISADLKRNLILQETVRDFARRVLPIKAFSTNITNVPQLQGTDKLTVRYYPLQAAASKDWVPANGYEFDQATSTLSKEITVNKRKYQPMDYSSTEFARQPYFDAMTLGKINAEKLAYDVLVDILSVVKEAAYGDPILQIDPSAINSDDVIDLNGACTKLNWPETGRSLIFDSDTDTHLQKDNTYKLALNVGGTEVLRGGKLPPKLSGFSMYSMPNMPDNGELLHGMAVFASAMGIVFSPINPASGVRHQLVAYDIATDDATGISMNYRHWGSAQADRDYEVIECAYGYEKLLAEALKRITKPAQP